MGALYTCFFQVRDMGSWNPLWDTSYPSSLGIHFSLCPILFRHMDILFVFYALFKLPGPRRTWRRSRSNAVYRPEMANGRTLTCNVYTYVYILKVGGRHTRIQIVWSQPCSRSTDIPPLPWQVPQALMLTERTLPFVPGHLVDSGIFLITKLNRLISGGDFSIMLFLHITFSI